MFVFSQSSWPRHQSTQLMLKSCTVCTMHGTLPDRQCMEQKRLHWEVTDLMRWWCRLKHNQLCIEIEKKRRIWTKVSWICIGWPHTDVTMGQLVQPSTCMWRHRLLCRVGFGGMEKNIQRLFQTSRLSAFWSCYIVMTWTGRKLFKSLLEEDMVGVRRCKVELKLTNRSR